MKNNSLILLALIAGCSGIPATSNPVYQNTLCKTFILTANNAPIGTGFFYFFNNTVFAITAEHNISLNKSKQLFIRPTCDSKSIQIVNSTSLKGIDLSVITLSTPYSAQQFIVGKPTPPIYGDSIYSVGYPNLFKLDNRYRDLPIPTEGKLIKYGKPDVLFTLDIIYPGSSGSPIVDANGYLIGTINNRIVDNDQFSGVGFGTTVELINHALQKFTSNN